ncbi:MAG: hypothetical protein M1357_01425 [Candidatus Marsarchaeota archaeon]|nr:hypothetical protein [Candidatus Marsarchaeota archaeon]
MAYFIDDLADLAKKMFDEADPAALERVALDENQALEARKKAVATLAQCGRRGKSALKRISEKAVSEPLRAYAKEKLVRRRHPF